jgi:phage terminase large subunit-like protein
LLPPKAQAQLAATLAPAQPQTAQPQTAQAPLTPPDIADWIDTSVTIEDPQREPSIIPFGLWPAQRDVLQSLQHERQIIILKARQLGITWLVLAYALHLCLFHANKTVIIISKDQEAANETIRRARGMFTRLEAKPAALVIDNVGEVAWSNGSRVKAFASSSDAGSSFTGSLLILDELAKNPKADAIYTSAKPTIDDGGRVVILSTAKGKDNLYHRLWTKATEGANNLKAIFIPWHARPGRDEAWYGRVAADAPTMQHHTQEYPATPEEAFQALAETPFLPAIAWWDMCREDLPPLGGREPVVVALDAATTNDSFGLAVVSRHPQRKGDVALRMTREWRPVDGVIRFGDKGDPETPRGYVQMLIDRFNVVQLCGDPYQLHQMFGEIRDAGRVYVAEFNQGAERLESDNQLKQLIIERRISHDGDATARRHIENADAKVDADAHKLRIVKREQSMKIDVAVCISMAAKRCLDLSL